MPIESIQTEADLDRFVAERIGALGVTDIGGLPDALAAGASGSVERFPCAEDIEVGAEPQDLPGCAFTASVDMDILAIAVLDAQGGALFGVCSVNGAAQPQNAICDQGASSRGTFEQNWPLTLKQGDEVTLSVVGEEGTVHGGHSGLTIVRVS